MAGGMDVHTNKHVEAWGHMRENLEKTFRFNRKTLPLALVFGVATPLALYALTVAEFVRRTTRAFSPPSSFIALSAHSAFGSCLFAGSVRTLVYVSVPFTGKTSS